MNQNQANDRIAAMRAIASSLGGWARLYGTKDLEQFHAQIEFMQDFEDSYTKRDIPFTEAMPTYADMSTAQLRCYFTWRTEIRRGNWRDIAYSYVLVYLFELMNFPGNAKKLAEAWLQMRGFHPKLDAKMPVWFKDYCLCYGLDFNALAGELGLSAFCPPTRGDNLGDIASYNHKGGRFFRERPELLPLFEQILAALPRNLEPLLAFYNLSAQEIFYPQPVRFSYYEPFKEAAVLPPELPGNREIKLSHSEIYSYRAGKWSRAMDTSFRPPSHAAGWLVKRAEAALRCCEDYSAPWNDPEAHELKERWLLHEMHTYAIYTLMEDPRLQAIITEAVNAIYAGNLPEGCLAPTAAKLACALDEEPYKTIREMQRRPLYAGFDLEQLREYLSWRDDLHAGKPRMIGSAFALLYIEECGKMSELCKFLRDYGSFDKVVARRLQEIIGRRRPPPELLCQWQLEAWFPAVFLFTEADQFAIFQQLSSYKLAKSRFYSHCVETHGNASHGNATSFRACFAYLLDEMQQAFKREGFNLPRLMVSAEGLTPFAGPFASFLLKRMEQRLRELSRFPHTITAAPEKMLGGAVKHRKRLHNFACKDLARLIDQAVAASGVRMQVPAQGARSKRQEARYAPLPEPPPVPVHVTVDFVQLDRIRDEAREMTELLIVEDEGEMKNENAESRNIRETYSDCLFLREALSPAQIAAIDSIVAHTGVVDELAIEAINEIALEIIGDNIIEGNQLHDEYVEAWNKGEL